MKACSNPNCNEKTEWIRVTQFAGRHPFCDTCAKEQKDFGKTDSSYFFWRKAE